MPCLPDHVEGKDTLGTLFISTTFFTLSTSLHWLPGLTLLLWLLLSMVNRKILSKVVVVLVVLVVDWFSNYHFYKATTFWEKTSSFLQILNLIIYTSTILCRPRIFAVTNNFNVAPKSFEAFEPEVAGFGLSRENCNT